MSYLKKFSLIIGIATLVSILTFSIVSAEEKATPEEVLQLILSAVPIVEELGDEGLEAFNNPKGEFVFKNTYVLTIDCKKMIIVAHPNKALIGADVKNLMDKNPDPLKRKNQSAELCEVGKNPYGGWVEYYWEKLGETTPSRKISFSIKVSGTDYVLISGIYDEISSVEELNKNLK